MPSLRLLAVLLPLVTPAAAAPFSLSQSYSPSTELVPGTYACRDGLDIDRFTYTFDVTPGRYSVHKLDNPEGDLAIDAEGTVSFGSGPFAPDATATMLARSARRVSDDKPMLILGYFFADGTDSYDFCARLE